ncbi:hypothetical protein LshimejAT787_1700700 [Lyophyllum shimeji]|uniref:Uncharacterized protein n=1 Tax=Lyophyllum shimeji TaxID=47721 RepID=A0A9P3PYM5_LYOSH|nr:hypothetical protein LshimejAT787_1700700 [Lyophyllum shimeji]
MNPEPRVSRAGISCTMLQPAEELLQHLLPCPAGDAVGVAFSNLVASWLRDTSCKRPLASISLNIVQEYQGNGDAAKQAMFERVRTSLQNAQEEAGRSARMVFDTEAFSYYRQFAETYHASASMY